VNKNNYLQNFFLITGLVIVLYIAAVHIGLFWIFDWYDSVMHIIGGMAIGYLSLWMNSKRSALWHAVILATSIGIVWEIFERIGNHFVPKLLAYGGMGDTILDVVCAIIGAVVIIAISNMKKQK
jgi:VanZ family protein